MDFRENQVERKHVIFKACHKAYAKFDDFTSHPHHNK